jgi:DNA-binding CsgD family transcriptional regulator
MKDEYSNGFLHDIANSPTYKLKKRLVEDYKLTPKEIFLAIEMYKNMRPNKQLETELQINRNTLIGRINSIYEKLKIDSRNQLIIKIAELLAKDNNSGKDIVKK